MVAGWRAGASVAGIATDEAAVAAPATGVRTSVLISAYDDVLDVFTVYQNRAGLLTEIEGSEYDAWIHRILLDLLSLGVF